MSRQEIRVIKVPYMYSLFLWKKERLEEQARCLFDDIFFFLKLSIYTD